MAGPKRPQDRVDLPDVKKNFEAAFGGAHKPVSISTVSYTHLDVYKRQIEHIAEEIEDMGKRDLNEVNSRVQVLVEHLLKWQLQPEKKSRSWLRTIASQRGVLAKRLEASPSLRAKIRPNLGSNYQRAVQLTLIETGLPKNHFPAECPFTVEQILDPEFLP